MHSFLCPSGDYEYMVCHFSIPSFTKVKTNNQTRGFVNSFGVFQTYYVTALNRPPSDIAWVGSVQGSLFPSLNLSKNIQPRKKLLDISLSITVVVEEGGRTDKLPKQFFFFSS